MLLHKSIVLILSMGFYFTNYIGHCQGNEHTTERLDHFMQENCKSFYTEMDSINIAKVLKYKVYHINQEIQNLYGQKSKDSNLFIVIDDGQQIQTFERIGKNTGLPKLLDFIKEDFVLNDTTALLFQTVLDVIYPLPEWKPDKREYFFRDGKWYFLRDAYFRTKQGFEITIDTDGKITGICYKMKWDDHERS